MALKVGRAAANAHYTLPPALFLGAEGLLVAFHGFSETFEAIKEAAFVQVGDRHGTVGDDGAIVALDRFLQFAQAFEGGAFFNQRLGILGIEGQNFVEAGQRFFGFIHVEKGLAFANEPGDSTRFNRGNRWSGRSVL